MTKVDVDRLCSQRSNRVSVRCSLHWRRCSVREFSVSNRRTEKERDLLLRGEV